MDKELIKEVVREMILSGEIKLGMGRIEPSYGTSKGTLILTIVNPDEEEFIKGKINLEQDSWDGLEITEMLHGV